MRVSDADTEVMEINMEKHVYVQNQIYLKISKQTGKVDIVDFGSELFFI